MLRKTTSNRPKIVFLCLKIWLLPRIAFLTESGKGKCSKVTTAETNWKNLLVICSFQNLAFNDRYTWFLQFSQNLFNFLDIQFCKILRGEWFEVAFLMKFLGSTWSLARNREVDFLTEWTRHGKRQPDWMETIGYSLNQFPHHHFSSAYYQNRIIISNVCQPKNSK